jgi:hypothetical protein
MSVLRDLPEPEIRSKLQELGDEQDHIFVGEQGSVEWHFTIPELPV